MIKWLALVLLLAIGQASIYSRYYAEAAKIAEAMSLDQRIGQTIQSDFYAITEKGVTDPAVPSLCIWDLCWLLVMVRLPPPATWPHFPTLSRRRR